MKDGLPDAAITALHADREGALWMVAGLYLSRYQNGRFTNYRPDVDIPVSAARAVCEDSDHDLWVAGFSRVVKRVGDRFVSVIDAGVLDGLVVLAMGADRRGWHLAGGQPGHHPALGRRRHSQVRVKDGLPDRWCAPSGRTATAICGRARITEWRAWRATAS